MGWKKMDEATLRAMRREILFGDLEMGGLLHSLLSFASQKKATMMRVVVMEIEMNVMEIEMNGVMTFLQRLRLTLCL